MTDQTPQSPPPDEQPAAAAPIRTAAPIPTSAPSRPPTSPGSRWGSPLQWVVSLALAAMVGALLFVGGYLAAGGQASGSCAAPNAAFEPFCEAYDKLKEQYVDDLDDEALAEGAIQGMFQFSVPDPSSGYMSPDDYQRALGDLSGRFTGIGAQMGVRNLDNPDDLEGCSQLSETCALIVIAPLRGSPAEAAGLQAGDIVLAVDGETVNGSTLEEEVNKVRGEAGTDVTLSIRREEETFDLTITRAEIQMQQVESRMLDDAVGYVALRSFSDASAEQFHIAVGDLVEQGAASFVFDLRDNPGGYIEAARKVASEFVEAGVIFTQESAGDEVTTWDATGDGLATNPGLELVVLINNGSASASEIVAAALQEHDRATIVGQHSYGKNTVQVYAPLENGGGVRITISRWFTPDHRSVAPHGVQPDVVVEVADGTPPERDLYLERAVEILAGQAIGDDPAEQPPVSEAPRPAGLVPAGSPTSYDPSGLAEAVA
jgi:carboxyl-terminal processing protease